MATLTGKTVANTYKDLLQVSNSNSGIDATLRTVDDGEGTSSVLKLSTTAVSINSITYPTSDGTNGQTIVTDGAGTLSFSDLNHDNLAGFVADEHIDWTDATDSLQTTGALVGWALRCVGASAFPGNIRLYEAPNSGGIAFVTIDVPQDLDFANNYVITLPGTGPSGANEILESDANGDLSWIATPGGGSLSNVVEDTTPQLGGQLDVNGNAIGDGTNELLTFTEDASAVNHINIENEATGAGPILSAAGDDANIDLLLRGKATGNVYVADGTDPTKDLNFELSGATTAKTMTITSSQTDDRTVTLPDATDTLVGKATTDTLTNKTVALGSNTVSGTKAQFDTAVTDGNIAYDGGAHHDGFSDYVANEHIDWTSTSSALTTTGALSTGAATIASSLDITNNGATAGFITLEEPNGDSTVKLTAPALAANYTLTFPVDDGTAEQVMETDGSGNLSWVANAGGGAPEGTDVLSTGEVGGTKFLREDGDGTCSWQTPAGAGDMVLADIQTVTGAKTFNSGKLIYAGATSGTTTVNATAVAGTTTLTLPAATDTLVARDTTDTLTNKTLTSPTLTTPALGTPASGVLTNCTGTAASLTAGAVSTITGLAPDTATTAAAQPNITSVGTLTALQVDNLNLNGNTLSSTAGTDLLITPLAGQQIVLDGTIVIDAGVVTGATSITSTSFVGALTGNADTVTTNANLTGDVTSSGNATTIAAGAVDVAMLANGTDGELITWDAAGAPATVAVGTSGHVLTSNGTGAAPTFQAAAGGSDTNAIKEVVYLPGSFESNNANPASLEYLNGTNVDTMVRAFDDTTVEYVEGKFQVPTDVDTSATVTFRTYSMAKTAAASKNVEYTFEHLALNDGEDFDPASPFTSEVSGDLVVDSTQDNIQEDTWTESITNLSWAANDIVIFRLSRTEPSANDLVGDLFLFSFSIEIPRA